MLTAVFAVEANGLPKDISDIFSDNDNAGDFPPGGWTVSVFQTTCNWATQKQLIQPVTANIYTHDSCTGRYC